MDASRNKWLKSGSQTWDKSSILNCRDYVIFILGDIILEDLKVDRKPRAGRQFARTFCYCFIL